MVQGCCVRGCRSNYGKPYTTVFRFPRDVIIKSEWLRCIPRDQLNVTKHTVVCIKHFNDEDVTKEDTFQLGDDDFITIPRKKWKLKDDAVPCIFPSLPLPPKKKKPSEKTEFNIEKVNDVQTEILFAEKLEKLSDILRLPLKFNLCDWCHKELNDKIILYNMDFTVKACVAYQIIIDQFFQTQIFYKDFKLDIRKFDWLLGEDFKCDSFFKIDNLITTLNDDKIPTLSNKEKIYYIKEKIEEFNNENNDKLFLARLKSKMYLGSIKFKKEFEEIEDPLKYS